MNLTNAAFALLGAFSLAVHLVAAEPPETEIRRAYKDLIDAENKHDLVAVRSMAWNSASTLFVAKAPAGWKGYWGIDDVIGHLHDMYQGTFRIDPIYEEEKVVFLTRDVAETYAPVKITVAYAGQNPVPRPFIMVLVRLKTRRDGRWQPTFRSPFRPTPRRNLKISTRVIVCSHAREARL